MTDSDSSIPKRKRPNGKGSVWPRSDGRWGVGWTIYDKYGDATRKASTAPTEEQAYRVLEAASRQHLSDWGYGHLGHLRDSRTSKVYFTQMLRGGPIKIGTARKLRTRLLALQSGCPYPLWVLHVIDHADYNIETALHRRFIEARLHGEWFQPIPELCNLIDRMKEFGEDWQGQKDLVYEGKHDWLRSAGKLQGRYRSKMGREKRA